MRRHRHGRALRRRHGHAKIRQPSRAEMIAALGLEPEGRSRMQKYAATTAEYWRRIRHGGAPTDVAARRKLGIS